jgi:hypothetical protein
MGWELTTFGRHRFRHLGSPQRGER